MSGGIVVIAGIVLNAANVGAGIGKIFRDKIGSILNIKSILAGTGINVINNADTVEIEATGAGANTYLMAFHDDGSLPAGVEFVGFWADNVEAAEVETQSSVAFAYTVKRITVHVGINSSDDTVNLTMRDDSVDVPNTLIAVPTLTTGSFDSGAISEAIAANSLVNIETERVGSSTFNHWNFFVECEK